MPKTPLHTLTWSQDHSGYELSTQGSLEQVFSPEDTDMWQHWLATATAFTFQGAAGRLNVYQETRREAGQYWYAYHTTGKRTHKRYLGKRSRVTFARLEEVASALIQNVTLQNPAEPAAMSDMPLLATGLTHPLIPVDLVVRERLLALLDAAHSHRLTLLSASAGWGKTTLLSMWADRSRFPVAWLSLSERENDPGSFWMAVIAALRHSGVSSPLVGEGALLLLRSSRPASLETILSTLVNDLSKQSSPSFLLLDDYQVIDEQAIHDSVLFLLEHLPAHLHLVVSSRIDPPLSLARLRARGALLELRDADLRFQEDEAADFLTRTMALSLEPAEITQLVQRTEGWIAGLHLAALALPHHTDHAAFVRGFAGSHRYLLDYVQEDILARITRPLQDFLLQCAILRRMSAELCQAVTAQADAQTSQQMLEQLERANLFLVPLDEERRWYRLHDLFREALLARLHATRPEMVRPLHLRAASWYEQQGEWSEAIAHRLAAADYAGAAQVIEQTAEQFYLQGEIKALSRWILVLPDEVLRARAGFALKITWYLLNAYAHTTKAQFRPVHALVERLLLRIEEAILGTEGVPQADQLRQRIQMVRLMREVNDAEANHDLEQFTLLVQQGMRKIQDDDPFWQMIPLGNAFMYHYTLREEGALVVPSLLEMRRRVSQSADRFLLIKVKQWLALAALQAGQLRLAHQESLEALSLLEHIQGHTYLAGYFLIVQARVCLEWNHLDEARALLRQAIAGAAAWQLVDRLMWGYTLLVELEIAAEDLQAASDILQEESFGRMEEQGLYQFWRTSVRIRLWLAEGKMAEANAWAAQVVLRPGDWIYQHRIGVLTLIRVHLAGQRYNQALDILEAFREQLDRPENMETTISFLSLSATALHLAGKQELARATVLRLLHLTKREGYLRAYLDMGEPMRQLLQSLLETSPEPENETVPLPGTYISTLLAAFEKEGRQRAMRRASLPSASAREQASQTFPQVRLPESASKLPVFLEPLTTQEQRVLQLLAKGLSTQAMAQIMVVSPNTVKTHLRNLYSKLQVHSRAQALVLARDLQLL